MPSQPPEQLVGLVRERDFLVEQSENDVYITGTVFSMPSDDIGNWAARDVTVRGYEVTLTRDLTLPGRNFTIACRV